MISPRIFKFISDGKIVLRQYNPKKDYEGVLNVLREAYMKDANTFHAFEMNKPETLHARREFEHFINSILRVGLSVVAHHLPSNQIAGFCINTMQTRPQPGCGSIFEEFRVTVQARELKNMLDYRILADKHLDLFNRFNTDNIFELVYMATHFDFRGRGIGHNLIESSVELAKDLAAGIYPRGMEGRFRGKIPKLIYGSFSSKYSARIAEKLGFVVVKSTPFNELEVDGIPLSSRIPPEHTHTKSSVLEI